MHFLVLTFFKPNKKESHPSNTLSNLTLLYDKKCQEIQFVTNKENLTLKLVSYKVLSFIVHPVLVTGCSVSCGTSSLNVASGSTEVANRDLVGVNVLTLNFEFQRVVYL